jgi:AraC-like DNA-binding protein
MQSPRSNGLDTSPRPQPVLANEFRSRAAIEDYLHRLNRSSPMAVRDITDWGVAAAPLLQVTAVPMVFEGAPEEPIYIGESQNSFGLDVRSQRSAAVGSPYAVGLLLSGEMRVTSAAGEIVARAGEGLVIDFAESERMQVAVDTHFVEFALPKRNLLRLGAELTPGELDGTPQFAPLLPGPIAQRLLFMVRQAADVLREDPARPGARLLFERWMEMITLTLLHEQRARPPEAARTAGSPPRSLSRAVDYIDAHAQDDLLLSDIAAAACVSVSSLLRQFHDHVGQSPMACLRQLRLDRAHAELRRGHAGSIRELAQRWGFHSAAKFSQAYLRRFGERPGDARSASR